VLTSETVVVLVVAGIGAPAVVMGCGWGCGRAAAGTVGGRLAAW